MSVESRIQHLEEQIEKRMEAREKLMESFVDAPGAMQSQHDHTRQDIATEISVIDKAIQDLRKVLLQLKTVRPEDSEAAQVGHTVKLQINDDELQIDDDQSQIDDNPPELYLLTNGLGGITAGDLTTLSVDTPIGRAVLGNKVGNHVDVDLPHGSISIEILDIE